MDERGERFSANPVTPHQSLSSSAVGCALVQTSRLIVNVAAMRQRWVRCVLAALDLADGALRRLVDERHERAVGLTVARRRWAPSLGRLSRASDGRGNADRKGRRWDNQGQL